MLRLISIALAALALAGGPALAQTFALPELGLQNTGTCRQLAARDRTSGSMIPLGCIDTTGHGWKPLGDASQMSVQAPDGTAVSVPQAFSRMRQVLTPKGAGMVANPFSADDATPATINRMADRLFLGGALANDGKGVPGLKDWLEATVPASTSNGQFSALAMRGNSAMVGGSRTSDASYSAAVGAQAAWGNGAFCLNDNTAYLQSCYGGYDEARRYPGAGITQGRETNILNGGSQVDVKPWAMGVQGLTAANWLSSGRPDVTGYSAASSVALGIVNNGSPFLRGIVFGQNAIAGVTNGTGVGEAITMASGHLVTWYTPDNTAGPYIGSAMTSAGFKGQNLLFQDDGPHFRNSAGKDMLLVYSPAAAANGLKVIPSIAGSSPSLLPGGADANIDLTLGAQGTGRVVLAAPTKVFATTVSGLPAASACQDCVLAVTDATSPTYRGALTGGGTVRTLVYSDGASWTSH